MREFRMAYLRKSGSARLIAGAAVSALVLAACGGGSDPAGQAGTENTQMRIKAASAVIPSDISVVELIKVSETRVSRTVFEYTFKVRVKNSGLVAYDNVKLTLAAVGAGASIIDGIVSAGSIAVGTRVVEGDTFTVRQDRTQVFDPAALVWRIEGVVVDVAGSQLAALEVSGAIPSLERGSSLQGVDSNANGVRDDVDAYIAKQYADPAQRAAATQAARALQSALLIPAGNVAAAKEISRKVTYAANCIFARFPGPPTSKNPARVMKELEGVTANTKQRLLAYLAYNKALDGTSSALPDGDTCE